MTTMEQPRIINLTKILDKRGNLSFFQNSNPIPFKIERIYWIYDVPGGESRGGHAYIDNQEFIVSLSGAFEVILDNGKEQFTYSLNRSYYGLYVPKGWWRKMINFSTNSVALIAASTHYSVDDYMRDYDEYLKINKV